MTTAPATDGQITRAALHAIVRLRTICAYEAGGYEVTVEAGGARLPRDAKAAHTDAHRALSLAAAGDHTLAYEGIDRSLISQWADHSNVTSTLTYADFVAEYVHPVLARSAAPLEGADAEVLSAALDELHHLRAVLLDAAWKTYNTTVYKTFPAARRRITEAQHARIVEVLSTWCFESYPVRPAWLRQAGKANGVPESLTAEAYAATLSASA